MSNLGIKKIKIPSNLELKIHQNLLTIKSNFGYLTYKINDNFMLEIVGKNNIKIFPKKRENKYINCIWGTQYSLLKNHINGLSKGYTKTLELIGVGFRSHIDNNHLILKLGYSHKVSYLIPYDVVIKCTKQNKIIIFGINKQKVNEIVSKIQLLKKVDPYKGKGILLENIKLRLKEGKKK
jgi:large subunit ribosomal protein L6